MANYASPDLGGDLEDFVLTDDPNAAYGRFLEGYQGRRGRLNDWLEGNYQKYYRGYLSESARNPFTNFLDYLKGVDVERDYANLSPQERGENPSSYQGRVRYMGL
jgi:hypothetical protein